MSDPIERACAKCGAKPGQSCVGARGHERRSFHRARGRRRAAAAAYAPHDLRADSPIEDALIGAILAWIDHHEIHDTSVATQVQLGAYRLDIVVQAAGRLLAIECDGAQFHTSSEAVERDKRRDRFCVTQGVAVMRFTGAEINRDPRGCAAQIGLWIRAQR